ncbi:MAG: T9SS type A sorting domain-containing protein, partial [Bacteroidota bacterium]
NGEDWWIIAPEWSSNCYYVTLIDSTGIASTTKQCIGPLWNDLDGGGQAAFAADGSKYGRIEAVNGFFIADFDNTNGTLTNSVVLEYPQEDDSFRGLVFSPSSQYIYVSAHDKLYQYDLENLDVQSSIQLVGEIDLENVEPGQSSIYIGKVAPDGKIYFASPGTHRYLSVINKPDCPGEMSDFKPHLIELPAPNFGGLPNTPIFTIPANPYECTTTIDNLIVQNTIFFPNPASSKVHIQSDLSRVDIVIHSIDGVKRLHLYNHDPNLPLDISKLPTGTYLVTLKAIDKTRTEKIVKL